MATGLRRGALINSSSAAEWVLHSMTICYLSNSEPKVPFDKVSQLAESVLGNHVTRPPQMLETTSVRPQC